MRAKKENFACVPVLGLAVLVVLALVAFRTNVSAAEAVGQGVGGLSSSETLGADTEPNNEDDRSLPAASSDGKVLFFQEVPASFYGEDRRAQWFQRRSPLYRLGRHRLTPPVHNCDGLAVAAKGKPIAFAMQQKVLENYATCFDISLYGAVRRPQTLKFDLDHLTRDIFRHLDVSGVPWSLGRRLGRQGSFRFADVPFENVHFEINRLAMQFDGRLFIINPDSVSDFVGDGGQQVFAVWVETALKTVDYHEGVMLLTRERKGGPIVARPIILRRPPSFTPPAPAPADKP